MKKILFALFFSFLITNIYADKKIITSYYPLYFVAKNIAPNWQITNLTQQDPHKFSPSPKDVLRVQKADLFFYLSGELEFWAPDLIAKSKNGFSIEEKLPSLFFHLDDNHDKHDDHDKHGDHDDHDHGGVDPHVWLDPLAMEKITLFLGKEFAKLDKKNSKILLNNSKKLAKKFSSLHKFYQSSLKNCQRKEFILSHNFLGYLARLYDFETYNIRGLSTLDEPSGKTILKLKKLAEGRDFYFLKENDSYNQIAEILQKEAGIKSLYIDNLATGIGGNFVKRMQKNAVSLKTALACK